MSLKALIWCAVSTVAQANEDEKYSLPAQESDAKALCQREGWQIVDVLRVPGHSRDYKSIDKLASDAAAKGIDAFYRLIEHLEKCDFDVLVCRDGNRFARRASLMAYIVESIVDDCGRRIYSFNDGWVDKQNAGMFAAMKGYSAAQDIKFLVDARRRGMHNRAERGLLLSPRDPLTHVTIRDAIGKAVRVELNPARRRLWDDLAVLILEGITWGTIEKVLYDRFGHVDDSGRIYPRFAFYRTIHSPTTWGHIAVNRFTREDLPPPDQFSAWVWDEYTPPPEGVTVYRNRIPAVYTGNLANRIQAELRRRADVIVGRAAPRDTYRYSGVFVCGRCGRVMGAVRNPAASTHGLRCLGAWRLVRGVISCDEKRITAERSLDHKMREILADWLDGKPPPELELVSDDDSTRRLVALESDIQAIEQQLDRLIFEQSLQPDGAQPRYRAAITQLTERLAILQADALATRTKAAVSLQDTERQTLALNDIRALTLAAFWRLSDREINQYLHRLLGSRHLVILDREIIGSAALKRKRFRKRV